MPTKSINITTCLPKALLLYTHTHTHNNTVLFKSFLKTSNRIMALACLAEGHLYSVPEQQRSMPFFYLQGVDCCSAISEYMRSAHNGYSSCFVCPSSTSGYEPSVPGRNYSYFVCYSSSPEHNRSTYDGYSSISVCYSSAPEHERSWFAEKPVSPFKIVSKPKINV